MNKTTTGKVIAVSKQWWLKINQKPVRILGTDGAIYPHIIKVAYTAGGKAYTIRKWIHAGHPVPTPGASIKLEYDENQPAKARIPLS